MQVYKAFIKILKKNLPSLIIYVVIFLALAFLLTGSGKANKATQFTQDKIDIAVINEDEGTLGSEFKAYLGDIHNLVELENDKEVLQDELYFRNVEYILFIPKDFTEKLRAGETQNLCENVKIPGSIAGRYIDSQIEQYITTLNSYVFAGVDDNQAIEFTTRDLSEKVEVNLLDSSITTSKSDDYYYFLYLPYILISLVIMGIGPILMVFNQKEINDRNLCSAMPLKSKNIQLILGSILTVSAFFAFFMVIAFGKYGKSMDIEKGILYIANAFVFLIVATSIGYFVSIFAQKSNVLNMVTNTVGLGMSFLGGIFVPREVLGENVLNISRFLPTYWYVNAVDAIQNVGSNSELMKDIQISIGIEAIFAIAIFAVALVATRVRSDARAQIN